MTESSALVLNTQWLTLAETVEKTGKSQSTIERWVAMRVLSSKLEPRPGRKPERLYLAEDAAKLAAQTETRAGNSRAVATPARPAPGPTEIAVADKTVNSFSDVLTKWADSQRRPPLTEILWLTLGEASQLSGIPPTALARLVKEGKIASARFGRSLRVRRQSLQAFEG